MRGSLIGLLLIAACYGPSIPSGAPCSMDSNCPESQRCIGGFCSLLDASGGIADRDKDTIADDKDNCPDAVNTDQADEDGDKRGDTCDLCPQLAETTPSMDGDRDGIGDACDPNPAAHDTVWLFEGFHGGLPSMWGKSAHWMLVDGSVRVSSAGLAEADFEWLDAAFRTTVSPPDFFTATTIMQVDQISPMITGSEHQAAIQIFDNATPDAEGSPGAAVNCGMEVLAGPTAVVFLSDDLGGTHLDVSQPCDWKTGMPYRLTLNRQGEMYTCSVVGPNCTWTRSGTSPLVPRSNEDAVGIWVFGVTAKFGSVQVIGKQ